MMKATLANLPTPLPQKVGWPWSVASTEIPPQMPDGRPWPKISVITPSYQQGRYIEETIRSVLLQNYANLEYIIIDGGSTDETLDIVRRYTPFLSYWISEKDTGQANAINKGFRQSTGEIMGWLNSDDLLKPNALYKIALTFAQHPDWQIVTGLREVIDSDSAFSHYWVRDLPTLHYLRHYCPITQETTYWRRELWTELGELDETFHYALDYAFWLRVVHAGYDFHLIPEYLGRFRDYPANKTNSLMNTTYVRDLHRLYHRYDMGFSEEDVLMDLGKAWAVKYRLFMALDHTKIMRSGKIAVLIVYLLEVRVLLYPICLLYFAYYQFRSVDPSPHTQFRWLSFLKIITVKTIARLFRHLQPRLVLNTASPQTIRQIRRLAVFDDDDGLAAVEQQISELPADRLFLGRGWHQLEETQGEYFRWVDNDAEIFVSHHTEDGELWLDLEAGPDQGFGQFTVYLLDEADQIVDRAYVPRRQCVCLQLNFRNKPDTLRCFRLHVEQRQPAIPSAAHDHRTLNFRVFELALYKSGALNSQSLERLLDSPFSSGIEMIEEITSGEYLPNRTDPPSNALLLGRNWSPLEHSRGEAYRWVTNDAEIILPTRPMEPQQLILEVAPNPSIANLPLDLQLFNNQGEQVGSALIKKRQIVAFDVNLAESGHNVFQLHCDRGVTRAGQNDGRILNFRVFRIGCDHTTFVLESMLERLANQPQARRFRHFYKRLPGIAFLIEVSELRDMMLHLGKNILESYRLIDQRVYRREALIQDSATTEEDEKTLSESNGQVDPQFNSQDDSEHQDTANPFVNGNQPESSNDAAQTAQLLQDLQFIFDEEGRHPLASLPILGVCVKTAIRIRNLKRIWKVTIAVNKRLIAYYQSLDARLDDLQTPDKRK